jgi:Tol biopolymer transport system component
MKRRLYNRSDAGSQPDVWMLDLSRGVSSRMTFDPACENLPIWSPNGLSVLFPSNRNGSFDLYLKAATDAGEEKLVVNLGTPTGWGTDWSRDGLFILYQIPGENTGQDLWIAPQFEDEKSYAYLNSQFNEQSGVFSPDGHYIAYTSDESGRNEIYVQSFPLSGSKYQISTGGGSEPYWRSDGKELFYVAADRNLIAVPIKIDPTFEPSLPKRLISVPPIVQIYNYAVSRDGQQFLVAGPPEECATSVFTVVLNWQAALKK